jgi:hypothetical protein
MRGESFHTSRKKKKGFPRIEKFSSHFFVELYFAFFGCVFSLDRVKLFQKLHVRKVTIDVSFSDNRKQEICDIFFYSNRLDDSES